jgi:hypothetical protein
MNVNVWRDFLDIAGSFKDRDGRRYVCKIGPCLRKPLFIIGDCGYDFRSLGMKRCDRANFCDAAEIGPMRSHFLWQLRHNTAQNPARRDGAEG